MTQNALDSTKDEFYLNTSVYSFFKTHSNFINHILFVMMYFFSFLIRARVKIFILIILNID